MSELRYFKPEKRKTEKILKMVFSIMHNWFQLYVVKESKEIVSLPRIWAPLPKTENGSKGQLSLNLIKSISLRSARKFLVSLSVICRGRQGRHLSFF